MTNKRYFDDYNVWTSVPIIKMPIKLKINDTAMEFLTCINYNKLDIT